MRLFVTALLLAALPPIAFGQDTDMVTLENDVLLLRIKKRPAPHIAQLLHKASGTSIISEPSDCALFGVALRKEDGKDEYIDSSRARKTAAQLEETDGGRKVVLTFANFEACDLVVTVTGTCEKKDRLTLWSIEVKNNSGRKINYVRFPLVKAVAAIGSPDDDFIVLPYLPGSLIENPAKNWPVNQGAWLRYPGDLSAQFISFQDRKAGIYLSTMDPIGHSKHIEIWRQKDGFCLGHDYPLNDSSDREWKSPYPAALGVTQGTWCDSADIYKDWARTQPWCAKNLAHRDDIPQWWKGGPLVHVCEVRTYDRSKTCNGSYYPKLLGHLRYVQEKTDGKIVVMLAGWENHRRWTAGDYFPVFDPDNAQVTIAKIKEAGFRPFFYLSGIYYTCENEGVDGSMIPAAEQYLPHYVVDQKTGRPEVFSLDESGEHDVWKRHSYAFCVAPPFVKQFFRNVIDKAHDLGVDILQMDQTVSGAGLPCYSTQHGHTPGAGVYQTQDFQGLLRDMARHGKAKSKEFVLFHEEPHEQLIPCLDGFHMREYKEKWWYRGLPGAVGIPLFSYLYHEYAIGYGGDSAGVSKHNDRWNLRSHAVNMVTGKTPGVATWWFPEQILESHPDPLTMLRHHCQLLKTDARRYLMLGRMLHPYEPNVPKVTYKLWAGKGEKRKQCDFVDTAILTSSWQAPDGSIGHLFVNVSEAKQTLTVRLDTRNAPPLNPCDVDLYSSGDAQFKPLWRSVDLPKDFTREVAPLEVLFVDVRKAK